MQVYGSADPNRTRDRLGVDSMATTFNIEA